MPARRTPKIEALVANAIRRLQDVQGPSSREISNYISQEYDVPAKDIRRQVQLVLQRGVSYGILERTKRGYYTCNRDFLGRIPVEDEPGDGVTEPCPWGRRRWRVYWRKIRARRRKARERSRAYRRRLKRTRSKRARTARRRRGRSRRRRRRRSRRRTRRKSQTNDTGPSEDQQLSRAETKQQESHSFGNEDGRESEGSRSSDVREQT
ncbi:luc7-like protein 3 [Harpegnathos saltator]|uniref:luc7-like protein 3 n=1 Tax=Harpegnathos saltator TaxID=610380 RepID=UPI000948A32E|nr:luc7-like protein 3 [Harpegnathos saltator]